MESTELLSRLRRLVEAEAGAGVLRLPLDLPADAALEAARAALAALEDRAVRPPPTRRGAGSRSAIRIHIDGAARGNPGPAGLGVAIFRADGEVLERLSRYIGRATNNVAEYRALLLALERAEALGLTDVEIYSDSELLVRQLHGRYQVKHPALRPLFAEAKERLRRFRRAAIHHVPREANAAADALANRGIDEAAKGWKLERPDEDGEGRP
ncbi:MAG: ribonuclease HI family protein [candidate division NC10 bacterium]|nr:ribonuclease HI family protein [candidate division NC10 bacterium]